MPKVAVLRQFDFSTDRSYDMILSLRKLYVRRL